MSLGGIIMFGTLPPDAQKAVSSGGVMSSFTGLSRAPALNSSSLPAFVVSQDAKLTLVSSTKRWQVQLQPLSAIHQVASLTLAGSARDVQCCVVMKEGTWTCSDVRVPQQKQPSLSLPPLDTSTKAKQQQKQHPSSVKETAATAKKSEIAASNAVGSSPQQSVSAPVKTPSPIPPSIPTGMNVGVLQQQQQQFSDTSDFHFVHLTLQDLLSKHKALVVELVHYLAPQGRLLNDIFAHVFSQCAAAAHNRTSYSVADVQYVVDILTGTAAASSLSSPLAFPTTTTSTSFAMEVSPKSRGRPQREMQACGFALVDVERYDSKRTKQLVANRAFPILAKAVQNSASADPLPQGIAVDAAKLKILEMYTDRDVVIAVRTGGGGIMAGLGTKKRPRAETDDATSGQESNTDDDSDDEGRKERRRRESEFGRHEGTKNAFPVALFTDLSQCTGVAWEEGDLSMLPVPLLDNDPEVAKLLAEEAKKQRQSPAKAVTRGGGKEKANNVGAAAALSVPMLHGLPITTDAQLTTSHAAYAKLLAAFGQVQSTLRRHEQVVAAARSWQQHKDPARYAESLKVQMREWAERQELPRRRLVKAFEQLRGIVYTLQRDITDYVNLHAMGVV